MMFLGLFTSRIVLQALGESDYGVYNVIGGVVAMFAMISGTLNAAVSRFITFEMGKGESAQLNKVYSTAVTVQFVMALIVAVLADPLGLWFIENEMTIDPCRIPAAKYVLHFSVLSFVINIMSVPQMASITAHERMSAYAYIGILEGLLRFGVALMIMRSGNDRLVLYAFLMMLSVLVVRFAYGMYCRKHFEECRYRPVWDRALIREMFSFAGWNFIGVTSGVLRDHGGNILINLFFGTAVNAARGVALQLNGAIQGFVTNFMTAVNPQITKSYASGDMKYMLSLVMKSSRMSFYLLFIIALPLLFNTEYVLTLWLKEVPQTSAAFMRMFLIFSLSESLSNPLITAQLATGNIRKYQIIVGGLIMLNLPVSYVCLKLGASPESTVIVALVISQICLAARLILLKDMIGLSPVIYIRKVYVNVISVLAVALLVPSVSYGVIPDGFAGFFIRVLICILSAGISILFVGCSSNERQKIVTFLLRRKKV